jgi:hypothetical protein
VALYSALSAARTDISPNTVGSRLGVATVQVSTRLETVMIRLNQYALAVKFEVYEITTIRRGLSSVSLEYLVHLATLLHSSIMYMISLTLMSNRKSYLN